jgi:hypothetical protein
MKVCSIHQPNFFPWLGYFDKIRKADIFILLDQVDYPKSGNSMGSWCNRAKINLGDNAGWISCPVLRESGIQLIDTVKIDEKRHWRDDIRNKLKMNYRESRNFQTVKVLMDRLLDFDSDTLADFNINAIKVITKYLGYETQFVRQSELPKLNETSSERLVALTQAVGADAYLCGGGSSGYLDDAAFDKAGLQLIYQNFVTEPYGDSGNFIPGLSVIDWLMHESG